MYAKMQELEFIKFSPENMKARSASLSIAHHASFLISALTSFQAVLKVTTAVANDSVLVEPDGEPVFTWHRRPDSLPFLPKPLKRIQHEQS